MVEAYDAATDRGAKTHCCDARGCITPTSSSGARPADAGALNAPAAKPSGPKTAKSEAEKENERLRERAEKAERELAKTKAALETMEKSLITALRHALREYEHFYNQHRAPTAPLRPAPGPNTDPSGSPT